MGTWELKLPVLPWIIIVVWVIVLYTNHPNGMWVVTELWHGAVAVIEGINRGLTALRTGS
jgi:hypothetical protein